MVGRRWRLDVRERSKGAYREYTLPKRCAVSQGYNLHAAFSIAPRDRRGLEQLAGYVCRPALAKSRLERRVDGMVVLNLKRTWSDGT